ncbi:replication stress response regulator SDE2-like [Anneissia japonica]|uniref:replication stress response regulator SDE2-like n=1 Tax=Anneissia japonica TaxID=1529436 RepID=UPI001425A545|nr:replication stress response regulator SDE2-like [Anneissia japonica]
MSIFVNILSKEYVCIGHDQSLETINDLKLKLCSQYNLSYKELRITHNGRHASNDSPVESDAVYRVTLPLIGGKGGFGSMLRMLGAQIEKTTNHEACRDLSGRRMRDVNNEKKLADWLTKKAELEREREEKRKAKLERMRSKPRHVFVDPNYDKQKRDVLENLDDAITQGLHASTGENSSSTSSSTLPTKRKSDEDEETKNKKSCLWMGVDMDSDSDDDDNDRSKEDTINIVEAQIETAQAEPTESTTKAHPLLKSLPPPIDESVEKTSIANETGNSSRNEEVDLEQFLTASELECVGLERLKMALMNRGLKCGGTLQERATRLFSVKGLAEDQIDPALLAKSSKGKKAKKSQSKN